MSQSQSAAGKTMTAEIALGTGDWQMKAKVTLPVEPVHDAELLPIVRSISEAVNAKTIQAVEAAGERIACCAGCGACCRHLVAISELEARELADLVTKLPEPKRRHVEARFAEAIGLLERAGLLDEVRRMRDMSDPQYAALAERYFLARVPCPLLEDESCSIHPIRPITCREYLVTSPPVYCDVPEPKLIRRVRVLLPVFNALSWWKSGPTPRMAQTWVPLVLALEWAKDNPATEGPRPAPQRLEAFLKLLAQTGAGEAEEPKIG